MDVRKWCNSGSGSTSTTIRLGHSCYKTGPVNSPSFSAKLGWKLLWWKFKKEKRKMLEGPPNSVQIPYDLYTYSQNFDQGFARDEPDNLSRSFSVRFADPSSIFLRKTQA